LLPTWTHRWKKAQEILEILAPLERLKALNELLGKRSRSSPCRPDSAQAKEEITRTQREYFLREQMRAIRSELGEGDERSGRIQDLQQKIKKAKMPKELRREARRELDRLEQMHPMRRGLHGSHLILTG